MLTIVWRLVVGLGLGLGLGLDLVSGWLVVMRTMHYIPLSLSHCLTIGPCAYIFTLPLKEPSHHRQATFAFSTGWPKK